VLSIIEAEARAFEWVHAPRRRSNDQRRTVSV
jgi:hypothetical protein